MLTIHVPTGTNYWSYGESRMFQLVGPAIVSHATVLRSSKAFHDSSESQCINRFDSSFSYFKYRFNRRRSDHLLKVSTQEATRSRLGHLHIYASSDEEFRSSRNIAISLIRRYRNVIDRGGGDNLKEFISAGVNAYALGCTDEDLRKELMDIKDSEIEGLQICGGGTSLRFKILSEEVRFFKRWDLRTVHECILWLSIIFITILCTPQPTIVRWSATSPVSSEILLQWKGFCALIANAYYSRGMAWLPVKTLQLEQMAVMGSAEEPSVVASRMRLVFSTLEVVSPQWPRV